jgi:hypothetical protein
MPTLLGNRPGRSAGKFVFGVIAAYLAVIAVMGALVVQPSALGWVGFGVAALISLAVGAVVTTFGSRTRANADRRHPRPGDVRRLLVVVDADVPPAGVAAAVRRRVSLRPHEVRVIAPVLASPLHFFTDQEQQEAGAARERLERTLQAFRDSGIAAEGSVGTDDPLQAVGDTLSSFPADEILLAAEADVTRRSWLERGLEQRIRDEFGVHVASLTD